MRTSDPGTLIVGVGGSAGSLSPLREFLAAIPADCGMAFVVVSHQAPSGHSMLPEILAKCTELPVSALEAATRVEPNHVYVEPRGQNVTIQAGTLSLEPAVPREVPHLPIDLFFRALARDQTSHAAGIVLSGTGTDGTLGLAAIRAASGFALVQEPATAEFDGMPASAIHARAADFVLPPGEMPARLLAHRKRLDSLARADDTPGIAGDGIQSVLTVMRQRGGRDFSEYKHSTLARRITRRMHLHGIGDLEEYARYLDQSDLEIDALWHDWLIGVSSFFRDPDVFQGLESAFSELLSGREDGSLLRIWVPGCATGEEAYSLVIVLLETLRRLEKRLEIQLFATDLNPVAIQVARTGRYPEGIAADVSAPRLGQFFFKQNGFYQVRKELRDIVVFAVQDALHDPPFTRIDLVSCRNLFIYLEPAAQQCLLSSFHYSLNPRGLLLLGSSEGTAGSEAFFSPLDAHCRIYRRNDSTAAQSTFRWPVAHDATGDALASTRPIAAGTDLANPLRRALAERFGPPAVLVDEAGQIQQIHGHVGAYLELQAGRVNVNVVEMARQGLRAPLASALREAIQTEGGVAERSARIQVDGNRLTLNLNVSRLYEPHMSARLFLVSFEPAKRGSRRRSPDTKATRAEARTQRKTHLEQELRSTRHDLQGSIEEVQAANGELAAANEELQCTNEELQSAKEETQSLNEELHSVNEELTLKLETFERATDDLLNLMNNVDGATIFLDAELRVKRFTPHARRVAHLIDSDIGRPLAHLTLLLDYPNLLSDAASVIDTLHGSETQAAAPDGSWYLVRIQPYRTARNIVEGAVVSFIDITDAKRNERLEAARALAESIVDAVREPFLVLDAGLRVVQANHAYFRLFRVGPAETDGRHIGEIGSLRWSTPALCERLEKVLQEGTGFTDFEVETDLPQPGRRRLLLTARALAPKHDTGADFVLLGIREVSGLHATAPEPGEASP